MEKKKIKTPKEAKVLIIGGIVFFVCMILFLIGISVEKTSRVEYLTEQYQKQIDLFNDWSNLDGNYELDKDTLSYSNIESFEVLYEYELKSVFDQELEFINYKGAVYLKTEEEIDRKLDIFFEVQGELYFDYGFEFSPGGGYFYLPKSVEITDSEHQDLEQKLALLENFEKFWRTRK